MLFDEDILLIQKSICSCCFSKELGISEDSSLTLSVIEDENEGLEFPSFTEELTTSFGIILLFYGLMDPIPVALPAFIIKKNTNIVETRKISGL